MVPSVGEVAWGRETIHLALHIVCSSGFSTAFYISLLQKRVYINCCVRSMGIASFEPNVRAHGYSTWSGPAPWLWW